MTYFTRPCRGPEGTQSLNDHLETHSMNAQRMIITVTVALLFAALAAKSHAQVLEKKSLSLIDARLAIVAAQHEARRLSAPGGVIAVVDDGGNLMALERLDNTFAAGANISIGKARTAALFKKPTKAFEDIVNKGRTTMVALNDFTPLQGGVPITVDGQVVGAIGVSGAASAQQDEELALAGARAVATSTATAAAHHYDARAVRAAFAKGAPISETDHYKIHASRRDAPGEGEVHLRDTDVIYVLEGSAEFVTGGRLVDAKITAPDEQRGARVDGGEGRRIGPGDVVVVPAGVPHWFKQVNGPVLYYVVKVAAGDRP